MKCFSTLKETFLVSLHGQVISFIYSTGSPSSKYKHRRASALLRNIQNVGICEGLSLCREKTVYIKTHKTAINRPVDHTGET